MKMNILSFEQQVAFESVGLRLLNLGEDFDSAYVGSSVYSQMDGLDHSTPPCIADESNAQGHGAPCFPMDECCPALFHLQEYNSSRLRRTVGERTRLLVVSSESIPMGDDWICSDVYNYYVSVNNRSCTPTHSLDCGSRGLVVGRIEYVYAGTLSNTGDLDTVRIDHDEILPVSRNTYGVRVGRRRNKYGAVCENFGIGSLYCRMSNLVMDGRCMLVSD